MEFLGHVIEKGQQFPQDEKIEKIKQLKEPQNKKQLKSVLGMVGYYRNFVPNYSKLICPLTQLLKKDRSDKLKWTDEHQRVFEEIKSIMSSRPVLKLPEFSKPFVLQCDASSKAIGGVLMQREGKTLHPIHYVSRTLTDCEKKYSISEMECLAIVWSVTKLDRYLRMTQFILQTDHKPLKFLKKQNSANGRLCRWVLCLAEYDFVVEHIQGSKNNIADGLSRLSS